MQLHCRMYKHALYQSVGGVEEVCILTTTLCYKFENLTFIQKEILAMLSVVLYIVLINITKTLPKAFS